MYLLAWFRTGTPVNAIQKRLGFKKYSYNSIYNRFMTFRRDIAEYCGLKNIPKEVDYARSGPRAVLKFRRFKARRMEKYRTGKYWNYDLYIREIEFMYYFRHLKRRELVDKLMEIHFSKRFKTMTKPDS